MRYSKNVDYLVSSILYLGTHSFYWARTPSSLARELGLAESHLKAVFEAFPSIYRRSQKKHTNGQHFYALQARYALREGGDTDDPERVSYIEPLTPEQIKLLTDFILRMVEVERTERRGWITSAVGISAALVSAATAVTVALLRVTP